MTAASTLKGSKVLVLGVAYKPDIDDVRESPALDVIGLLKKKGAIVEYHDPYIPHIHHEYDGWQMDSVKDMMKSVKEADAVVIVTNHKEYDYKAIIESANSFLIPAMPQARLGKTAKRLKDCKYSGCSVSGVAIHIRDTVIHDTGGLICHIIW